jgi:TonB-dependent SusC/RagA subfamily outer membrane receptor
MVPYPRSALLPAGLVVGLLTGCGHASRTARQSHAPPNNILTAEDIEAAPSMSLEQLLVTRIPGLSLSRATDGHMVIHIRGTTTFKGEEEPLYVLDGVPLEPTPGGNLAAVNRYDIATIEVLRDAVSTARYGIRGSNGVIIITMKSPPKRQ